MMHGIYNVKLSWFFDGHGSWLYTHKKSFPEYGCFKITAVWGDKEKFMEEEKHQP